VVLQSEYCLEVSAGGGNYCPSVQHHAVSFKSVDNSLCSTNQSVPFNWRLKLHYLSNSFSWMLLSQVACVSNPITLYTQAIPSKNTRCLPCQIYCPRSEKNKLAFSTLMLLVGWQEGHPSHTVCFKTLCEWQLVLSGGPVWWQDQHDWDSESRDNCTGYLMFAR